MSRRGYGMVSAAYWGFTLTDGALRMLVLLHFHELGYTPLSLASLFLLYELCGVVTNLVGGWAGSRLGLKTTLCSGLATQVAALIALSFVQEDWVGWVTVGYVMAAQALSGVAKDLTKVSAKSAVKLLATDSAGQESHGRLFQWVALLTGSKNALKGLGFFVGGVLLSAFGFRLALWTMAAGLVVVLVLSGLYLTADMGRSRAPVRVTQLLSKTREINVLSLARFFLFGSRDVWFVVALPIFLADVLGWSFTAVGGFLAAWVIGYGGVQAAAPALVGKAPGVAAGAGAALSWSIALAVVTGGIALALQANFHPTMAVLGGLALFGGVFAVNASVHSYLILAYTDTDRVTLDVGFYYMANAGGRLVGTMLSGLMYLAGGLTACLWVSTGLVLMAALVTAFLPTTVSGTGDGSVPGYEF
jgi:hypothetical protein